MASNTVFIAEFLLFGAVALGWAAWEYWSIRPGKADRKPPADAPAPHARDLPEGPGHPER